MTNEDFLISKQKYITNKVDSIMRKYSKNIKYDIKFRNGKMKTAGTILTDTKTKHVTFVFSNYWILAFLPYEIDGLIKHECAHALGGETHGEKFKSICKTLKCAPKWTTKITNGIHVYENMVK